MIINIIIEDIKKVVLHDDRTMCHSSHFPITQLSMMVEQRCGLCQPGLPQTVGVRGIH